MDERQRRQPDEDTEQAIREVRDRMAARRDRLRHQQWISDRDVARGAYYDDGHTIMAAMRTSWMPYMRPWTNQEVAERTDPDDRFTLAHQQRMRAKFPVEPRGKFKDKPRQ